MLRSFLAIAAGLAIALLFWSDGEACDCPSMRGDAEVTTEASQLTAQRDSAGGFEEKAGPPYAASHDVIDEAGDRTVHTHALTSTRDETGGDDHVSACSCTPKNPSPGCGCGCSVSSTNATPTAALSVRDSDEFSPNADRIWDVPAPAHVALLHDTMHVHREDRSRAPPPVETTTRDTKLRVHLQHRVIRV